MLRDRCPVGLSVTLGVYCGQTVEWIKMPLGAVGPGNIVLDGDPAPLRKGARQPPTFQPMSAVGKVLQTVAHLSNC